jgi:N-acetylglucosamine-6-phosphate deacetylase
MLILSGADVVQPDGVVGPYSIVADGDRIAEVRPGRLAASPGDRYLDLSGHLVVPGFVDVHVHGVDGVDVLDDPPAVARIASGLPRYGVTSFCPTTVACDPIALARVLGEVRRLRASPPRGSARVLPAHLESNFISAAYRGAQPLDMLRAPGEQMAGGFGADEVLTEIARAPGEVAVVTVAPEIDGGVELVRALAAAGHRVSLGHSGASFDVGRAAIAAGASQATHLFNGMPPLGHREPGLAGEVLADDRVAAELICDGIHVHPAMLHLVVAAKGASRVMAITDGLSGSGRPEGSVCRLGGRTATVRQGACYLPDGTLAGSAATFDAIFRVLIRDVGLPMAEAVCLSSTTPALELGLADRGRIAPGLLADLVVLDRDLQVVWTFVGGVAAFGRR